MLGKCHGASVCSIRVWHKQGTPFEVPMLYSLLLFPVAYPNYMVGSGASSIPSNHILFMILEADVTKDYIFGVLILNAYLI